MLGLMTQSYTAVC